MISGSVVSISQPTSQKAPNAARWPFTPRLRLFTEQMGVVSDKARNGYREEDVPVASLTFDYGGTLVRCTDSDRLFAQPQGTSIVALERDRSAEAEAQCLLEVHGALEAECLEEYIPGVNSQADYVIQVNGNVHSLCSFTAYALGTLKAQGWSVEVDPEYPYHVVNPDVPWYAKVEVDAEADAPDWFSLELGVEIDGHRVNMLPPLLDMLDACGEQLTLDSLMRVPARCRAVPAGLNRYVVIPKDRLERLLVILMEMYRGERTAGEKLTCRDLLGGSLAKLDEALCDGGTQIVWDDAPGVRTRGRTLAGKPPTSVNAVSLKAKLRPYQEEGVCWLQHMRQQGAGGVLADDMGLGKTLQTITHLLLEKESRRAQLPTLIVAPTSLIHNWDSEIKRFAPALRTQIWHGKARHKSRDLVKKADVVLTTYALLIRDLEWFKLQPFYYLILDEAQAIKNRRSQAAKSMAQIQTEHRLCLTGTPVENNLDELFSLFNFLMPGILGTAEAFRTHFREPIERENNETRLAALRGAVGPFILRRMKEEVARDLPPKTEMVRPVELREDQRDLYESVRVAAHSEVRQAIKSKGIGASTVTILDGLMKLRQICCDPRLVKVASLGKVLSSAKYELFFDLLQKQLAEGRRVLVFSQFTRMLALLGEGLVERGIKYALITGATVDRQKQVRAFQEGQMNVFLISLKAGGTGLNLTRADTVIHYDPWWNAAAQSQATDRAYRIGQTEPVFVHNLIVSGSVEERMVHLQQRKRHLAETILGGGHEASSAFSLADVEDLFAPLEE
ncbi:MAG: DEAD/DEAH box helicase [Polyangiaceae bacterium]|nr:DEAD/DEAH box helicase [Polyangiaceae bacterium]